MLFVLFQSKNQKKIRIFDPRAGTCISVSVFFQLFLGELMIFMVAGGVWSQWVEGVPSPVAGRQ